MSIVDDPMLALIVRFVAGHKELYAADDEFLEHQLEVLKSHVAQFPKEQQSAKALEWIEQYAEIYRRDWQKKVVSRQAGNKRCNDCPLILNGYSSGICVVHNRWIKLLKRYLSEQITSATYVEDTLRLLEENKTELKVELLHSC